MWRERERVCVCVWECVCEREWIKVEDIFFCFFLQLPCDGQKRREKCRHFFSLHFSLGKKLWCNVSFKFSRFIYLIIENIIVCPRLMKQAANFLRKILNGWITHLYIKEMLKFNQRINYSWFIDYIKMCFMISNNLICHLKQSVGGLNYHVRQKYIFMTSWPCLFLYVSCTYRSK